MSPHVTPPRSSLAAVHRLVDEAGTTVPAVLAPWCLRPLALDGTAMDLDRAGAPVTVVAAAAAAGVVVLATPAPAPAAPAAVAAEPDDSFDIAAAEATLDIAAVVGLSAGAHRVADSHPGDAAAAAADVDVDVDIPDSGVAAPGRQAWEADMPDSARAAVNLAWELVDTAWIGENWTVVEEGQRSPRRLDTARDT